MRMRDRYLGCLLGGAVGDALGGGIEFSSLAEILGTYGPTGITGYVPAYGRLGAITDDTQMTLFTAEGLLEDQLRPGRDRDTPAALWHAYRRWLTTQSQGTPVRGDSWLLSQPFLHEQRSPGNTCLSALSYGEPGSAGKPVNDSKGCGGVMRVAPVGLALAKPFIAGCEAAALTHGHPSGYLAAGAFALMISELVAGGALPDAVAAAIGALKRTDLVGDGSEVIAALEAAVSAARTGGPSVTAIAALGEGWVAEEALAISVYCALTAATFRSGVLAAVNHGGDSDSTGAICGNLLGASLGVRAVDADLLDGLEGEEVITQVAEDLYAVFAEGNAPAAERYLAP
jgi:ADP-ribosylglycohydrolase